jgi:uncharacterized membrane protein YcfT
MSGETSRLSWVDTAKGISIILVVMMYSVFNVGSDTGEAGFWHYVIGFATPFRMPEFFLISGLFLSLVIARPWRAYADRRVIHYFYFYALWAVIHLGLKVGLATRDPVEFLEQVAWAIVEPYGVLWFIYLLAVFSAATKLLYELKAPHWVVFVFLAALQMTPVATGSYLVDQFSEYFVYFYVGYAFASWIFGFVAWTQRNLLLTAAGLAIYAVVNAVLIFTPALQVAGFSWPGFDIGAHEIQMGLAALPGVRLVLALAGSLALCVVAAMLTRLPWMNWLRWLGEHSIVVYLAFVLPMSISRIILEKFLSDTTVLSTLVIVISIVASLVLYWLVQKTGWGKFLFERPAWAHLPGTKGSRSYAARPEATPAE